MRSVVGHTSLLRNLILVGMIATLLTVVMAWPVVQQPEELLFGSEIVGRHADAYSVIQSLEKPPEMGGTTQPGIDWLGHWIARSVGAVAAYNLLVLVSFPLTAMAVFALARYLGVGPWPAAWAALLCAFSPLHIAHGAYHPHVAQTHWIPLVLLAVIAATDRWTPLRALLMVVATAAATLTNFYAALLLLAVLPLVLWVLRSRPVRDGSGWRATVWTLVAFAATGLAYAGTFHSDVIRDPWRLAFPATDAIRYAARWFSYLVPGVDHPLTGGLARGFWARFDPGDALVEQQVYLGWSVIALAAIGVVAWRRSPALSPWRSAPLLATITGAALVLSLSPVLGLGSVLLPTPSWLLRSMAPMFRAYARFGFVVQLAVLLLAGLALTYLARRGKHRRPWLVIALAAIGIVEFLPFPPWRAHPLYPHSGYLALEELQPGWAVLDCTLEPAVRNSVAALVGGGVYVSDGDVLDCGEPDLAAKLAARDIGYAMDRVDGRLTGRPGFTVVEHGEGIVVYAVEADPAAVYIRRWAGFSWREGSGRESIRWAGTQAGLWLHNSVRREQEVDLDLQLVAFPGVRNVRVVFNGEELTTLEVAASKTWFELRLPLQPSRNRLQLIAEGAPSIPDSILGNGDRRLLAVGVGGVRYPVADQPAAGE